VVCAGALEVLNQVANANFLSDVNSKSDYMRGKLSALPPNHYISIHAAQ